MSGESSNGQGQKSWLTRIIQALSGETQTLEDLLAALKEAGEKQILDADTLSIMEGAAQAEEMQVRDIMIPRTQMVTVRANQAPDAYLPEVIESAHSRFPVLGENQDDVVGILLAKDLLPLALNGDIQKNAVLERLRPATFVPESKRLIQLLSDFRENRNHMAIVIDEYGGIAGLVTIEDVLEQIVGEIEDEHDIDDETAIKKRSRTEYVVKAQTEIEEFNEFFSTALNDADFDTIGGLVTHQFGRLPSRGESVELEGFRFTVLNADSRIIRLLQVNRLS